LFVWAGFFCTRVRINEGTQGVTNRKILVVDDEESQRNLLKGFLAKRGWDVTACANGEEAVEQYRNRISPLALVDMKMPGMNGVELIERLREINPFVQAIMLTAFGSVQTAVAAMKAGAVDYLTKPIEDLEELLLKLERASEKSQLVIDNQVMSERLAEVFPSSEIIGESPAMQRVKELISLVAGKDATVLVTGPSGTGKELVARAVHALSPRADKELVAINCAAFPETLLESELFGYEKGAFTGADRAKPGRFELADGGTLFLDEIGEMPLTMQVKLLRVLEARTIQRLGSVKEVELDIRIIAATNRDLDKMVKEGGFREDLFYRLNVINVGLPALKDRAGDLMLLSDKFLAKFAKKVGKNIKGISADAAKLMVSYDWPGNVRELENVIERAVVLARGDQIAVTDLSGLRNSHTNIPAQRLAPLAEIERDHIKFCLDQLGWNLGDSAAQLGIHRNTLRTKIKQYQLVKPE